MIQGNRLFSWYVVIHLIIANHISLVNVQTNDCNNNPLSLDVKQLRVH